ncbi:MAG: metal-sensing transcriptional repressor [Candidatus Dormibacteraeota bacterium]|nr:metal-sensing transcriptional repressor [Candidatus Dormibacteraeota bacterium]
MAGSSLRWAPHARCWPTHSTSARGRSSLTSCSPLVLTQIAAATAALEKIGFILLRDHVQTCIAEGIAAGQGEAYLDELIATVQRFAGR